MTDKPVELIIRWRNNRAMATLQGRLSLEREEHSKLIVYIHPVNHKYSQIVEYSSGTVSSLAFPDIKIVLDRLLLF